MANGKRDPDRPSMPARPWDDYDDSNSMSGRYRGKSASEDQPVGVYRLQKAVDMSQAQDMDKSMEINPSPLTPKRKGKDI